MKIFLIVFGIILLLFLIFSAVCFSLVKKEMKGFFGKRADRGEFTLQDKKTSDFKKLIAQEFNFNSRGEVLRGKIYYKKPEGNIIIVCHGYGAGHEAYLTEINSFVQRGYTVVGFDYRGCVNSSGILTHFGGSVEDLKACYEYLLSNSDLSNKKIYLWGHSWGAYTALCGTEFIKAQKVIALCPFDTPVKVLTKFTLPFEKKFSYLLIPYRFLYLKFKFGKYGNISSFKTVESSNIPALIITGKLDTVAPQLKYKFTKNNIKVISLENKGHNPYNTVEAETYLNKTLFELSQSTDIKKTLSEVDYDLITTEDEEVMNLLYEFYKE